MLNKLKDNKITVASVFVVVAFMLCIAFFANLQQTQPNEVTVKKEVIVLAENDKPQQEPIKTKTAEEIKAERIAEYQGKLEALDEISSKEEWFVAYKELYGQYEDVLGKLDTIYNHYTEDELDLFFRVVQAEIGDGYSFSQKANVASVIFNRMASEKFSGDTFEEILNKNQFCTVRSGAIWNVAIEEKTILACEYVYLFGDTTDGALFFDSNGALNYSFLFNDGAHNFYTKR